MEGVGNSWCQESEDDGMSSPNGQEVYRIMLYLSFTKQEVYRNVNCTLHTIMKPCRVSGYR